MMLRLDVPESAPNRSAPGSARRPSRPPVVVKLADGAPAEDNLRTQVLRSPPNQRAADLPCPAGHLVPFAEPTDQRHAEALPGNKSPNTSTKGVLLDHLDWGYSTLWMDAEWDEPRSPSPSDTEPHPESFSGELFDSSQDLRPGP